MAEPMILPLKTSTKTVVPSTCPKLLAAWTWSVHQLSGLYTTAGKQTRGTKRPLGIATLLRFTNNKRWFDGSALYNLDPPIQIFEYGTMTETNHVIVANVPAINGIPKSTTIFAASGRGILFGRFHAKNDFELAEVGPRLFGKHNHSRVLSALQGGYAVDASRVIVRNKTNRSRRFVV